jgi:hypothetical protein
MSVSGIGAADSTPTLTFSAVGLPTIAAAWYNGDSMYVDPDSGGVVAPFYDPLGAASIHTVTVGVDVAPTTLTSLVFRLGQLNDSSCTLAWITDSGLCTSLRSNWGVTIRFFGFTSTLDSARTGGSAITDPAYFMLRANADYILNFVDLSAITVSYVCGNTFRIRSQNYAAVPVTYQLPTGSPVSVTLPARTTDYPMYTDTNIDPGGSWGAVQVKYGSTILNTLSNGGTSC